MKQISDENKNEKDIEIKLLEEERKKQINKIKEIEKQIKEIDNFKITTCNTAKFIGEFIPNEKEFFKTTNNENNIKSLDKKIYDEEFEQQKKEKNKKKYWIKNYFESIKKDELLKKGGTAEYLKNKATEGTGKKENKPNSTGKKPS